MNKKGFVLLESIVVLVVVALSLSVLMSSFSLVSKKTKAKEYYDRASDKYFLYAIMNLGTDDKCNYWDKNTCAGRYTSLNMQVDVDNCSGTKAGWIIGDHCKKLFEEFGITHLYVVDDIRTELSAENYSKYDNGTIEYMKTLKKCADCSYFDQQDGGGRNYTCDYPIPHMIGVFNRGGKLYYASVLLSDLSPYSCCAADSDTNLDDPNHEICKKIKK